MHRKALGKGLDALFSKEFPPDDTTAEAQSGTRRIINVPINDIIPNRDQPREVFSEDGMEDLKRSIQENGILEPPVVRRKGEFFELIAGERRYRAAKELHFDTIEVILMDSVTDEQVMVLSLIENIQREDLNAIEEGKAYLHIMDTMQITQGKLSDVVGKSRSTIANTLRLLNLTEQVRDMISEGILAAGSARPLVTIEDPTLQLKLAGKIAGEGLSSRKAEALVKKALSGTPEPPVAKSLPPFLESARTDMQRVLGTEVKIKGDKGKGKIEIKFYSDEDLARILEAIKGSSLE